MSAHHIVDLRGIKTTPGESYLERLEAAFRAVLAQRREHRSYEIWLGTSHWLLRAIVGRELDRIARQHGSTVSAVLELPVAVAGSSEPPRSSAERDLLRFRAESERIIGAWRVHVADCAAALTRRQLERDELRRGLEESGPMGTTSAHDQLATAEARVSRDERHLLIAQEGMSAASDMLLLVEQGLRERIARGTAPLPTAGPSSPITLTID